ncbi:hypothetical protein SLE2022_292110 [Rubroshorea leprosula]
MSSCRFVSCSAGCRDKGAAAGSTQQGRRARKSGRDRGAGSVQQGRRGAKGKVQALGAECRRSKQGIKGKDAGLGAEQGRDLVQSRCRGRGAGRGLVREKKQIDGEREGSRHLLFFLFLG